MCFRKSQRCRVVLSLAYHFSYEYEYEYVRLSHRNPMWEIRKDHGMMNMEDIQGSETENRNLYVVLAYCNI